jgi:hypothetical protein
MYFQRRHGAVSLFRETFVMVLSSTKRNKGYFNFMQSVPLSAVERSEQRTRNGNLRQNTMIFVSVSEAFISVLKKPYPYISLL